MTNYNVVSADSHINEPRDVWKDFPASMRDLAPKLVSTEKGDGWVMGPGAEIRLIGPSGVAGRKREEYMSKPVTYDTMRPGSYEPGARLKDMDIDHVDAEVIYPGVMRSLDRGANPEARLVIAKMYNEWLADFCKHAPTRLVGVAVVPAVDDNDGKNTVEALRHAAKLGLRSVYPIQKEGGQPLHHPNAAGFWAAAEELNMPVSIHASMARNPFFRNMTPEYQKLVGSRETLVGLTPMGMAENLSVMIFGGIFKRHPKLKVVLVEGGAGWIPWVLERLDHTFKVHRPYMGSPITEQPSETFARQIYTTFGEDMSGVRLRDMMGGADNLMWASDYPHSDTSWPLSVEQIDRLCEGVPANEKRKMVCDNAARLYGLTH
jgi:uncharacterized protein